MSPRFPVTITAMPRHALMLLLLVLLLVAARTIVSQPLISADGAFQTWSAISAFAEGRAIGHDFQSYLGVLMPLSLTPFFLLGGASFGASAVVAAVAVVVALFASLWLLVRLAGARRAMVWQLTSILFLLIWVLIPELTAPGVSLRPLRWAAASFATMATLPLFRRLANGQAGFRQRCGTAALLGLCAGIAILWANDVGVPIALALTFTSALLTARWHGSVAALAVCLILVAVAVASAALIMAMLSHGHLSAWFNYTFIQLPQTQFWYFGPWGERNRVFGLQDISKLVAAPDTVGLLLSALVAVWAAVRIWLRKGLPAVNAAICCLYASIVGGAILPQIGGHIGDEYLAATKMTALLAPLILFRGHWPRLMRSCNAAAAQRMTAAGGTAALFLLALLNIVHLSASLPSKTGYRYLPLLRVWAPPGEQGPIRAFAALGRHFDKVQQPADRRLLSDYPSALLIAVEGKAPTAYPSIIHALGPGPRQDFIRAIATRRAPFVTTLNSEYSGWAIWNLYSSWPAYRAMIENYRPIARSQQYIVWKERPQPLAPVAVPVSCRAYRKGDGSIGVDVFASRPSVPLFVQLDLGITTTGPGPSRWFWTVSPQSDDPKVAELYDDSPSYGAPAAPTVTLAAELTPGKPRAHIDLLPTPARAGRIVAGATCRATSTYPVPDYQALPMLARVEQLLSPR